MEQSVGMLGTGLNWYHRFLKRHGFWLFFLFVSLTLLDFSNKISIMNRSDYPRTVGFLLGSPVDLVPFDGNRPAFLWSYLKHPASPLVENNSAAVYFWLLSTLQKLINPNFDLYLIAFFSKAIILFCCLRAAVAYVECQHLPREARYLVLALFALAFFYAHNIAAVNSLYSEHIFAVGIAILLMGVLETQRNVRVPFIGVGLLLSAASKPQFFYLPILFGICALIVSLKARKRVDAVLVATLAIVQAISFLPLLNASTKQVNYYHSLYFGSYKLLTTAELQAAGIRKGTASCIGVDWWGWKMTGADSVHLVADNHACHFPPEPLTLTNVLAPYVRNPFLLIRLAAWSLPDHFTIHYFEVLPTNFYLRPSNGTSYRNGSVLIAAANFREAVVTRLWIWIVLAGVILPFLPDSQNVELRTITLFLSLAVPTQIAACLLGEGVRDLSRHLAGAQLCLDLLSMICLLHALGYLLRALARPR